MGQDSFRDGFYGLVLEESISLSLKAHGYTQVMDTEKDAPVL